MKKTFQYQFITLFFVVFMACFTLAFYALGWTEPTQSPPLGNIDVPVNIGAILQTKQGGFGVNGVFSAFSNIYVGGNVGINALVPVEKLQVNNGDIWANQGDVCQTTGAVTTCLSTLSGAGGDITGVTAGTGLTGGGTTGTVTLNADTNYMQRRVSSSCAVGSSIREISSTGTVTCETDDTGAGGSVSSLSAGNGITLSPNPITTTGTISANTSQIQVRVTGTCPVGSSIRVISSTGTVTCETDDVGAGGGSPGGVDSQIQYNNGGVFGGANVYYDSVNTRLGIGVVPQENLHVSGDAIITANLRVGGLVSCDTIDTDASGNLSCGTDGGGAGSSSAGLSGYVQYSDGAGDFLAESNLFYDAVNNRLGIGLTNPSANLHVNGNGFIVGALQINGATRTAGGLIIETRISDPAVPITGQMWLRTDL